MGWLWTTGFCRQVNLVLFLTQESTAEVMRAEIKWTPYILKSVRFEPSAIDDLMSNFGFYVPFNSQGHIGTGFSPCHLWDSNHTQVTACS